MLGLQQVVVVMNKMDMVEYSQERFDSVKDDVEKWLKSINVEPLLYIPISAINGENIVKKSEKLPWYSGMTFLQSLDTLQNTLPPEDKSMLLPIQDVYKVDDKRINAGRVETGTITEGDEIKILPSGQITKVKSIEKFLEDTKQASASECIGFTTTDSVFLDRGDIICTEGNEPELTDSIPASIFWMIKKDYDKKLKLTIRCATQETSCKIETIKDRINSSTLEVIEENAHIIKNLEVAEVIIKTKKPIAIKNFNSVQELGRFVLVHDENICAGGIITVVD